MLTIIDCGVSRGYSGSDHLIVDSYAKDVIGRTARTLAEAKRIVARAAGPGNPNRSPVWVVCRTKWGDKIEG